MSSRSPARKRVRARRKAAAGVAGGGSWPGASAVSVFFVPKVVTTATTLVQQGPVVKAVLTDPAPVGHTTIGRVATAVSAHPATVARLQKVASPPTAADRRFLAGAARTLGPANLAALAHPTPALGAALKTLAADGPPVARAAADSPRQWRTFFFVGVGGEVVFIPLILLMAGFWDPRAAKRAELEHDAWLEEELRKLRAPEPV